MVKPKAPATPATNQSDAEHLFAHMRDHYGRNPCTLSGREAIALGRKSLPDLAPARFIVPVLERMKGRRATAVAQAYDALVTAKILEDSQIAAALPELKPLLGKANPRPVQPRQPKEINPILIHEFMRGHGQRYDGLDLALQDGRAVASKLAELTGEAWEFVPSASGELPVYLGLRHKGSKVLVYGTAAGWCMWDKKEGARLREHEWEGGVAFWEMVCQLALQKEYVLLPVVSATEAADMMLALAGGMA